MSARQKEQSPYSEPGRQAPLIDRLRNPRQPEITASLINNDLSTTKDRLTLPAWETAAGIIKYQTYNTKNRYIDFIRHRSVVKEYFEATTDQYVKPEETREDRMNQFKRYFDDQSDSYNPVLMHRLAPLFDIVDNLFKNYLPQEQHH